ncbi:MAG: restriction endonuclease [Nitrososphaerales archaeon]
MNSRTLLRLIPFINEGSHTRKELSEKSGLGDRLTKEMLQQLAASNIGHLEYGYITFSGRDKISSAILAVKMGCSLEEVSKQIEWRDFEDIVSEMLSADGYTVRRNFRLKKPRVEIDVLAFKNKICLAIDCKHWKRTVGASTMKRLVERQVERAEHLAKSGEEFKPRLQHIYPVIATLYEEDVKMIDRVSIVPITKFTGFLREFEGYSRYLKDVCNLEPE